MFNKTAGGGLAPAVWGLSADSGLSKQVGRRRQQAEDDKFDSGSRTHYFRVRIFEGFTGVTELRCYCAGITMLLCRCYCVTVLPCRCYCVILQVLMSNCVTVQIL